MALKTLWLSPKGRTSRKEFWLRIYLPCLGILVLAIILDLITNQFGENSGYGISAIVYLLLIWPMLAATIKRSHDRNRSGWFILLFAVPVLNLWPTIEVFFLKGTEGKNQFGYDPIIQQNESNNKLEPAE